MCSDRTRCASVRRDSRPAERSPVDAVVQTRSVGRTQSAPTRRGDGAHRPPRGAEPWTPRRRTRRPEPLVISPRPSRGLVDGGSDDGTADCRQNWRLPTTERSVTVLRRGLTGFLDGADLSGDERYDLLLAVCEAASNAIEHALNPTEPFFDVHTQIGDAEVTVVVRDFGQWTDGPPGVDRGRGMAMMWMLADSRIVPSPHGTTVTIHSRPRHPRHPVPPHGERGTAGRSPNSSSTAADA
jgi:anti-sigma regulatory factor (Ser/Thr protein kinase)